MRIIIKINDDLQIIKEKTFERTTISLHKDDEQIVMLNTITDKYFTADVAYNKDYIVTYSKGCMVNQIPLHINSAYDINNQRFIDLDGELRTKLEFMLISYKGINLENILALINNQDNEETANIINFLSGNNESISREEVVEYIFACYPKLKSYSKLGNPISLQEYNGIIKSLNGTTIFWFHIMPQMISKKNYSDNEALKLSKSNNSF